MSNKDVDPGTCPTLVNYVKPLASLSRHGIALLLCCEHIIDHTNGLTVNQCSVSDCD